MTTYRRARSGLYYSTNGNFKIERRTGLTLVRRWYVFVIDSHGYWNVLDHAPSLRAARNMVETFLKLRAWFE